MCGYLSVCIRPCIHPNTHECVSVCLFVMSVCLFVCLCPPLHTSQHTTAPHAACMCVCVRVCVSVCLFVSTLAFIPTHHRTTLCLHVYVFACLCVCLRPPLHLSQHTTAPHTNHLHVYKQTDRQTPLHTSQHTTAPHKPLTGASTYNPVHCKTLQHTATHCNTLQHNATHTNHSQERVRIIHSDHRTLRGGRGGGGHLRLASVCWCGLPISRWSIKRKRGGVRRVQCDRTVVSEACVACLRCTRLVRLVACEGGGCGWVGATGCMCA